MTGLIVAVGALGLLVAPGLAHRVSRGVSPREWTQFCAASLVAGSSLLVVALALLAFPTLLLAAGLPAVAAACRRMGGGLAPGGSVLGGASTAALVAVTVGLARATVRARRVVGLAHVDAATGHHLRRGLYDVVTLPSKELVALSVPGTPPQILLSESLVAALEPDELEAVIEHETAHLEYRHQAYLSLAATVRTSLGWLPLIRRSVSTLCVGLERWADDEASKRAPGGRATVRDALMRVAHTAVHAELAAFSTAVTLAERLDALSGLPNRPSRWLRLALRLSVWMFGILAISGLALWVGEAHMMLAMSGLCRL